MANSCVIVGGGISGLVAAYSALNTGKYKSIQLIEKAPNVGGALRGNISINEFDFDSGMHNFSQSGIESLDEWMFNLLPKSEINILEKENRDLSGAFYGGKLQLNTRFIDISELKNEKDKSYLADFFINLSQEYSNVVSAYDYFKSRFGDLIAKDLLNGIVEKLYQVPADKLDSLAIEVTGLSRIVLFKDENLFLDLMKSDIIRDRLAFPEQRNLPLHYSSQNKNFYPNKMGTKHVIEAMEKDLKEKGIRFYKGATVEEIEVEIDFIKSLNVILSDKSSIRVSNIDQVYWTISPYLIANSFDIKIAGDRDKPLSTVFVHFVIDKPLLIEDLHYFYVFDKGFSSIRLNYYQNFCPGAKNQKLVPFTLELLVDLDNFDDVSIIELAKEELLRFNIMQEKTKIISKEIEKVPFGFPRPTLRNIEHKKKTIQSINDKNLKNLHLLGAASSERVFFQPDVIRHSFNTVQEEAKKL